MFCSFMIAAAASSSQIKAVGQMARVMRVKMLLLVSDRQDLDDLELSLETRAAVFTGFNDLARQEMSNSLTSRD